MARRSVPLFTASLDDIDVPPDRHPALRTARMMVGLFLLLIAVWFGWSWIADRQLESALAELASRHPLPPRNEGLNRATDGNSTAFFLAHVVDGMELQPWADFPPEFDLLEPLTADQFTRISNYLVGKRSLLAHVRHARQLAGSGQLASEGWAGEDEATVFDRLHRLDGLYWLVQCALVYSHARADDVESFEQARDSIFLANTMRHAPTDKGPMMAGAAEAMGAEELGIICEQSWADSATKFVSPVRVKQVIDALVSEAPVQLSMRAGAAADASELAE